MSSIPPSVGTIPRPRLAFVIHDYDPNLGQGRYCVELAKRLHPHYAIDIHAATFRSPLLPNMRFLRVPAWRRGALSTVFTFIAGAQRSLRQNPADIVHAQGLSSWSADIITGHMCVAARTRKLPAPGWRAGLFTRLVTPFERGFYRQQRARHLIAISRVLQAEVAEDYGWVRPVSVIYHGTDCEKFRPAADAGERNRLRARFRLSPTAWTWIFMGEAVKGLRECIAALPSFPAARLLVVSRSRLDSFQAQARELGVFDRIHFHGFDPQPEEAFRAADVFVYPNEYDPFGMVVTEAMASGLPCVVGKRIGAAELIADGDDGFLCDPRVPATVVGALQTLAATPSLAGRIGAAARAKIQPFSWDACATATAQVYDRVWREKLATQAA
jgi:glycosyltransferase involved in cell wall biosynthesis